MHTYTVYIYADAVKLAFVTYYCNMTNKNCNLWLLETESHGAQHNHMYFWCVCLLWDIIMSTGRHTCCLVTVTSVMNLFASFPLLRRFSEIYEQTS